MQKEEETGKRWGNVACGRVGPMTKKKVKQRRKMKIPCFGVSRSFRDYLTKKCDVKVNNLIPTQSEKTCDLSR